MDRRRRTSGLIGLLALGCHEPPPAHDLEALRDPETCAECHPDHYREWLGSMHAYASEDPVFRAMNARGQRETQGELGDFCVSCHAPMAVALDLTTDGLNLDELPREAQGVTCYACHQVSEVEGTHNNPLRLALDGIMRGPVVEPLEPPIHGAGRSSYLDRGSFDSALMCGSCHDIVTPLGAHIERTYAEWQGSLYAHEDPDSPGSPALYAQTCGDCHMPRTTGPIAEFPGVRGDRQRHGHRFVGVDVALTDFPDAELGPQLRQEQLQAIADVRKTSLCASLCVRGTNQGGAELTVWLHNEGAGHAWPSGAAADRRAWVELRAVDAEGQALLESGVVEEGVPVAELDDPALWLLRDQLFDAEGQPTHMFWEAASYQSELLPVAESLGGGAHEASWVSRTYSIPPELLAGALPDRVDMRVLLRPMGLEILTELVDSGDLDPAIVEEMGTYEVPPANLTWTAAEALPSEGETDYGLCVSSSPGCKSPAI